MTCVIFQEFWFVFLFADIEAECQDDYMKIRIGFNGSFNGLLYSAGQQLLYFQALKLLKPKKLFENWTFFNFDSTFSHTSGYAYDPDCMYINGSGRDYYEFYIQLNRCGTLGKNSLHEDSRKNPTVSGNWLMCGDNATFLLLLSRKTSCGTR